MDGQASGKASPCEKTWSPWLRTILVASWALTGVSMLAALFLEVLTASSSGSGAPQQPSASSIPGVRQLTYGAVREDDASMLLELAKQATLAGDGYSGRERPFTPTEVFSGATPTAIARWARRQSQSEGRQHRSLQSARRLLHITKTAKDLTEDSFGLKRGSLDYDFIHVTCRRRDTARSESGSDSHPAHADNCFMKGGKCVRASPMYFWRSHTAIVSLNGAENGDFEGGDFFFSPSMSSNTSSRKRVVPKAGLLTAFTAGGENIHGVEPVLRGTRCQLSIWLTDQGRRASHAGELKAAEAILDSLSPPAEARTFDVHFGKLCEPTSSGGFSKSARSLSTEPVAELELPGEDRTVSVNVVNDLPGPQVSEIHGFLTRAEIDHIIRKGSPNLKAAVVFEGATVTTANYRTSTTSWLKDDPEDPIVLRILERIKVVTGLSLLSAEELQLAHYSDKNEGKYEPHFDWGSKAGVNRNYNVMRNGDKIGGRIATLLIYLTDVGSGGGTAFTALNKTVAPEAGKAVFFYDLHPSVAGDEKTLHGGCPVLRGEKAIVTKWFHELGNEALFDAAEGLPRFARDWPRLAEKLRGAAHQEPLLVGVDCGKRRSAGDCTSQPLRMARACPGFCEEHLAESTLRERHLFEGFVSANAAQDILQLATGPAAIVGDGYGGRQRPLSRREVFSGIGPTAAARWAASQPRVGGLRAAASRQVRAFLAAAAAMQQKAEAVFAAGERLFFDAVHLVCRRAATQSDRGAAEDEFLRQNRSISAGSDLLVATMTIAEARSKCLATAECQGFTFQGEPTEKPVTVYLKSKQDLYGQGYGWTSYLRTYEPAVPDSHPPHADNCYRSDRDCVAGPPRLHWRSHSMVLFLNGPESGDFTGGSFFYTPTWDSPASDRLRIEPRMGRMVAYSAGAANIHGVEEVKSGTRCAIAAWLTADEKRAQAASEIESAQDILNSIT